MSHIKTIIKNNCGYLVLNRPEQVNVIHPEMAAQLNHALQDFKEDDTVHCVVIEGAGRHFMAGGDIEYFKGLVDESDQPGVVAKPPRLFEDLHEAIEAIHTMDKPVLAKGQGAIAGYGLSLLLACDLAIVADNAVFSTAYSKLGTTPDGGMSYFLPRHVGLKRAKELMFLADRFDAQMALNYGVVNQVCTLDTLDDLVETRVQQLIDAPHDVLARTKHLINNSFEVSLNARLSEEISHFEQSLHQSEFTEGVLAFVEKRAPKFNQKK